MDVSIEPIQDKEKLMYYKLNKKQIKVLFKHKEV